MSKSPPAALTAHLTGSVRAMRRRYRKRLDRCQKKFSETSVHELRIETRRMLALVDLLRALHAAGPRKKIRKVFKQRLDSFDELRDTHVQLRLLKPLWREFPEARGFDLWLRRREKRLIVELRHAIKATKQLRVEQRLKDVEKGLRKSGCAEGLPMSKAQAAAALQAAFAGVIELHQRVRRSDTTTIHRMRVAFKRFRYMSELLQPLFPRLITKQLRQMQAYQALMGDIQDLEVLLAGLAQAVARQHLAAVDARGLRSELQRRRDRLIDLFMAEVDKLLEFHPERLTRRTRKSQTIGQ
jgi:CHAD domain-containing protein